VHHRVGGETGAGTSGGDALIFRSRYAATASNPQNVHQVWLDTDGNSATVEWGLVLDMSGTDSLKFFQTLTGGPTLDDIVAADSNVWEAATGFHQYAVAGTSLGGGTDTFRDMGMDWSTFTNITGVTSLGQIRVLLSSSASHSVINKDRPLTGEGTTLVGDGLSDAIPEPATFLLLGIGGMSAWILRRLRRFGLA